MIAAQDRIRAAWGRGTPSEAGRHVVCGSAALALSGAAVVTVLTNEMYERMTS